MSYERSGAWTVDHALRVLATGCARSRRPVPAVGALVLGAESVLLRLTTPEEAPPPGWAVEDDGRTWRSSLAWLGGAEADNRIPEPYPMLVSVGLIDGGRLLLNLAAAEGLVGVEGDPELARNLVRSWARRLPASPWAAGIRVVRVGFPPDNDAAGWDVARLAGTPALDNPAGGVVLFADPPLGRDLHLVNRLLDEPTRRWSVVAVGAPAPTWRFVVGVDGTVDTGLLAEPVRLRL